MDSDTGATAEVLDLRGLKCPLPALLAKRAVLRSAAGTLLDIVADDPLAAVDIPHMCAQESFDIVSVQREETCVRLRLKRPSAASSSEPPADPIAR
jgi:tRNA 2-thiouridine synthesizing protein A